MLGWAVVGDGATREMGCRRRYPSVHRDAVQCRGCFGYSTHAIFCLPFHLSHQRQVYVSAHVGFVIAMLLCMCVGGGDKGSYIPLGHGQVAFIPTCDFGVQLAVWKML